MRKILVLDAAQRSALAVTRAVGQLPNVQVTTADTTPMALAGQSKYSRQYLHIPCAKDSPADFLAWIQQNCLNGQYDLIMPVTEVTSQLLLMQNYSPSKLPMAFANYNTVMQLADKANLVQQAQAAGVSVPSTQFFENSQALQQDQISYPIILKPAQSKIFTQNQWITTTVRLLQSASDLKKVLSEDTYLTEHPFMLQEFIPGHGAGVFCLFNQGTPVRYFAHQRLREKPPEGGVSVLSKSVPVPHQLKDAAEQLLKQVNWHGVAMVEFRVDPQGKAYLMEVNTRFWGSLQLAIDAGVNFPVLLTQQFFNDAMAPETPYKTGQRLRWLLGDLDSLYIALKRPNPLAYKLRRIGLFLTPRFVNQRHEVNRLGDLKPAWFELKHYLNALRG